MINMDTGFINRDPNLVMMCINQVSKLIQIHDFYHRSVKSVWKSTVLYAGPTLLRLLFDFNFQVLWRKLHTCVVGQSKGMI